MKISACMIAKNEEKVIARCIESYRMAVDEIIVVDTGSTDRTVAIAKELGAKVFHFAWIDDFAAAKNYALSQAKGDWIIFLDADEYFAQGTGKNLRPFLQKLDKGFGAVGCRMLNIDEDTGKVITEVVHVRIFKNDQDLRYTNPIHEELTYYKKGETLPAHLAAREKLLIYHTGYSPKISKEKAQRNMALLLKQVDGDTAAKPEYLYYIADTYFSMDEWEKAIRYIRLFMNTGTKLSNLNTRVHNILIDAMINLQYPAAEVMAEIGIAIARFPQHPVFYFYQAKLLYDDKQYEEALLALRQALSLHQSYEGIETNPLPVNLGNLYNMLGVISELKSDYGQAVGHYLEALKLDRYEVLAFERLVRLIRTQPLAEIVSFLNTVYDLDRQADLDFLSTSLVNHPVPKVLAYYTSLREKKYPKEDYVVLQMLVANGYYDKAFKALLDCYDKDRDERLALAAATAAVLSGEEAYTELAVQKLPPTYGKVLRAYISEDVPLDEEDKSAFLSLVRTFYLWAGDEAKEKLLKLADRFAEDMMTALGELFLKEGDYSLGLGYYNEAIRRSLDAGALVHPVLYYNQGYCLHRLNRPVAAVEAFVKAYEMGYKANDIYEYLRWDAERLEDGSVKARAERIVQFH